MMVFIGLRVTFAEIVNTARSWPLIARAAAANYLLVPVLAIVLHPVRRQSNGPRWLSRSCGLPGGPYGPPFAGIARANVPEAVGLMVILAGSSAETATHGRCVFRSRAVGKVGETQEGTRRIYFLRRVAAVLRSR
jgi:hypothetical protein